MKLQFFNFIEGTTTLIDIQRQRRALATKLHPDKPGGSHDQYVAMEQEYQQLIDLLGANINTQSTSQKATPPNIGPLLWEALKHVLTQMVITHPEWVVEKRDQVKIWIAKYLTDNAFVFVWLRMLFPEATTTAEMSEKLIDMVMELLMEKISKK